MDDYNLNDEFGQEQLSAPVPAQEKKGGGKPASNGQKKRNALIAAGAIVLAALFFVIGWLAHFYSLDARARKLLWLIDTVDDHYYKEIPDEEWDKIYARLYDTVLPDIFCTYYTTDEYKRLLGESEGSNKDTGLAAVNDGDALRVYSIVNNSPAFHKGLEVGMQIYRFGTEENNLKAGDRDAFYALSGKEIYLECGYSAEETQIYSLGSANYLASYCTYRDSETSYHFLGDKELLLTDTKNPLSGLDGKTAYISLAEFDGNADKEFKEMLVLMKERGRENLVIDLRRNGGGYLSTFQSIASHLLKNAEGENPLVASAKYRSGKVTKFRADGNDFGAYFSSNSHVSILADERTASASECLIGALVDYGTLDYGDIYVRNAGDGAEYGAHTYGKGVMQSAFVAADKSMLRLTSAEIFWPNGKSVHGKGVTELGDGATGISAPLLPGKTDVMLQEVLARLNGGTL